MRMGNPAMRKMVNRANSGELAVQSEPATYAGIALKSAFFGGVTLLAAIAAVVLMNYAIRLESETLLTALIVAAVACLLPMVICSLVAAFAPKTVKISGTLYSLFQGFLLGLLVCLVDIVFPGVAFAAVLGTIVVFLVTLVLNRFLGVRVKGRFARSMLAAFLSLVLVELLLAFASPFIDAATAIMLNFWVQLGISALCVFYAAVMLMWDFQSAEEIVTAGADKSCEWIVAYCLVTTLVYLYIELLELLIRLAAIFGKDR